MDGVQFRMASLADVESLVALRAAFLSEVGGGKPATPELLEAMAEYFRETIPTGEFVAVLAGAEGGIVGTSGMVLRRRPPSVKNPTGREAYIMNMYTVPGWRGRGMACELLSRLIGRAQEAGCRQVRLHSVPEATALYARAGFVPEVGEMRLDV